MKRNKKKFKRLTKDERTELSNLNWFYTYNACALRGKDLIRRRELRERKEKEDEIARKKFEESLRDKAYKWL